MQKALKDRRVYSPSELTELRETFVKSCYTIMMDPKTNGYAKAYARAGLVLDDYYAIGVQALYILNNIGGWRGEDSKSVRTALKRVAELTEASP